MVFLKWLGRLIIGCCGVAAAGGAWYVVYQGSSEAMIEADPPKPLQSISVEVVSAREDAVQEKLILVGNFLPDSQTEVRPLVDGYIRSLPFDVGDRVRLDQVLCQLDDSVHRDRLQQARATFEVAEAQLAVQFAELKGAQQILDRETMLDKNGVGTLETLENALANKEIAEARLKLEEARVAEAKAQYTGLEIGLTHFELKSPISGYVSARFADIGDLAKPDASILQLVDLDKVRATVQIIEKDYRKVALGQQAAVSVDAYPDKTFVGEVKRIAPTLDQETRTASAQIEVNNQDLLLKPGMYARVSLKSEARKNGVTVPLAAILEQNDRPSVYVVNDSQTTELRLVRLGTTDGTSVEILEGVQSGEQVITLGNRLVQPGQKVIAQVVAWPLGSFISQSNETDQPVDVQPSPLAGE